MVLLIYMDAEHGVAARSLLQIVLSMVFLSCAFTGCMTRYENWECVFSYIFVNMAFLSYLLTRHWTRCDSWECAFYKLSRVWISKVMLSFDALQSVTTENVPCITCLQECRCLSRCSSHDSSSNKLSYIKYIYVCPLTGCLASWTTKNPPFLNCL